MSKFIILGSGPCGLATAYGFAKKGMNVEVYESRDRVGGLGGSEKVDGMVFDYGPHIYHTHDEKMKQFWKKNLVICSLKKNFFKKLQRWSVL